MASEGRQRADESPEEPVEVSAEAVSSTDKPQAPKASAGSRKAEKGKRGSPRPVDGLQSGSERSTQRRTPRWIPWVVIGAIVLIGAAVAGTILLGGSKTVTNGNGSTNGTDVDSPQPRALDGVSTTDETNPTPVAVMIENIVESRPQSGLDQASVVYEALAEGGITRFLAIFGPFGSIPEIGPVRSARPYYVDWAEEYGALYAHAGGSPQALDALRNNRFLVDFNQFAHGPYFWRDSSRFAPHNLYTSSDKLIFAKRDLSVPAAASFTPWTFLATAVQPASADAHQSITIDWSSFNYRVQWTYDPGTNRYARAQAGKPHTVKDGTVVTASNVVVQFVDASLLDTERLSLTTIGTGPAKVFRSGTVIEGTWSKPERGAHTRFLDASGNPIPLNPGTTWVEAVPNGRSVTVDPAPTP